MSVQICDRCGRKWGGLIHPDHPTPKDCPYCSAESEAIRMRALTCGVNKAFSYPLPDVEKRPNPDTVAALDRWSLILPGQHAAWDRFVIMLCSLADFPGVPPAVKHFPEATHEVDVFAIDPRFPKEAFDKGSVQILEPVNYVHQFVATDEKANQVAAHLAERFVRGELPAEPQGITINDKTAREYFADVVAEFLKG